MKKIVYIVFSLIVAQAPISDAGPDLIVDYGAEVQLDGTNSRSLNGTELSYNWTTSDGIDLTNSSTSSPSFTAPASSTVLTFSLTVTDGNGVESAQYPSEEIFISEYHHGDAPNQYIELYNGTDAEIDLTGYELWLLKSVNGMSWDPIYNEEDEEWEKDFWVLLFNSDTSMTNMSSNLPVDGDLVQRVDTGVLAPNETLMIIRQGDGEDFDFVGRNFVVWDRLVKLTGDDPIALRKNGIIIDKVGDDENVSSSGWDIGGGGTTTDHTLIRKGTVLSGNSDWISSGQLEWDAYESIDNQWYFDDVFNHNCTSCDDEVVVYVTTAPIANASYLMDNLLLDSSGEICDTEVVLDASSSTTPTGDINYQWIDDNDILHVDDLTKKQPSFSTIGLDAGTYEFGLMVYDGLLESAVSIVSVTIADNLCPTAFPSVVVLSRAAVPAGQGTLAVLDGHPSEDCLSDFEFFSSDDAGVDETELVVEFSATNSSECSNGVDVCLSIQYDSDELRGDLNYTSTSNITSFSFNHSMNGIYDEGEDFVDSYLNEAYDESEDFTDSGEDGCFDEYEDGEGGCLESENEDYDEESNPDPNGDNWSDKDNPEGTEGNNTYDEGEDFVDALNGIFDEGQEEFTDWGCIQGASEGQASANGLILSSSVNSVSAEIMIGDWWSNRYPALVLYDEETFSDKGNGVWDEGETFYDVGDFVYTCFSDDEWNIELPTICLDGEDFIDVNQNGVYNTGEPFVDIGDGIYSDGEQFDDIGNGVYDDGEDYIDVNGNGEWDDSQRVYLSALGSSDPDEDELIYTWDEITGLLPEDGIVNTEENGSIVNFIRPDFDNNYGELQFSLTTHDGLQSSEPYILTIKFANPSRPSIPLLSSRTEHQQVILSWDTSAEESQDLLTDYFDFEGYKLYKSIDGGETWGTDSDKIFDDTGKFVSWKPFRQWDLNQEEDEAHCNYSSGFCSNDNRNTDFSGYDPYSYWINIGENNGLVYSFVDTAVVDGVEYTYALTSYDTGVWTTYEEPASGEILWYDSNPNRFIDLDGSGFPSMESEVDIENGSNFITVVPGYYAGNIEFPDASDMEAIFTPGDNNYSDALIQYELVDLNELEPVSILFEIQAKEMNSNNFEGLATKDPRLYAYYVDSLTLSPIYSSDIPYGNLLNSEIDSILDLPGTFIDDESNMIVQPDYELEDIELLFVDDLGYQSNWTDYLSGTRMKFTNPWREYGHAIDILNISDLDNIIQYDGPGAEYYAPIIGENYFPSNDDEDLSRRINYTLKYAYQSTFLNRPPYRYRIEFSKEAEHEALQVWQDPGADENFTCLNSSKNTMLPFRVYNMTTERYVGLRHMDLGFNAGGDPEKDLYEPSSDCEEGDIDNYVGDCDCIWTMYEDIVFIEDTVTTRYNTLPHPEATYSLELSYDFFVLMNFLNSDPWNENFSYDEGRFVIYGQTKWKATTDINPGVIPGTLYDPDGDGVDNGNPWKAVYPWSNYEDDNIELIIEPWTWLADGDKWVADLSSLGSKSVIDEQMLSEVTISPNPYMRHSGYNESSGEHKLKFSKLPNECEINIFTISGERVRTIQFQDIGYYGNYFWDQKNGNGDFVAPGLYIYTIEDKNYKHKHIGKFAIVR